MDDGQTLDAQAPPDDHLDMPVGVDQEGAQLIVDTIANQDHQQQQQQQIPTPSVNATVTVTVNPNIAMTNHLRPSTYVVDMRSLCAFVGIFFLLWTNYMAGHPFQSAHHQRATFSDEKLMLRIDSLESTESINISTNVGGNNGSPTTILPHPMDIISITVIDNNKTILDPSAPTPPSSQPLDPQSSIATIDSGTYLVPMASAPIDNKEPTCFFDPPMASPQLFLPTPADPTHKTNTPDPSFPWKSNAMAIVMLGVAFFLYRRSWINEQIAWVNENTALRKSLTSLQERCTLSNGKHFLKYIGLIRERNQACVERDQLQKSVDFLLATVVRLKDQVVLLQDQVFRLFTVDVLGLLKDRKTAKLQHEEALAVAYSGGVADGHCEI